MGIVERRDRQRVDRERRIVAAARIVAEREGWAAVTIRRLAEEIEHSQPVIYSHFENRDGIVAAVAVQGFRELAAALRDAAHAASDAGGAAEAVAAAYLAFAREHPALYAAMFTLPTRLHFAVSDAEPELRDAFAALGGVAPPSSPDPETSTETFWAALHGLAELERSGRIRAGARGARAALVAQRLMGS